jgi:hypothetical protein
VILLFVEFFGVDGLHKGTEDLMFLGAGEIVQEKALMYSNGGDEGSSSRN